ncbi:MAG: penicillin-binding protein [Candidatus Peregrinibacteria bacterium]
MAASFQTRLVGHETASRPPPESRANGLVFKFFSPASAGGIKKSILRIVLFAVLLGAVFFAYLWFTLPDISDPSKFLASQSTVITDRNGTELYRLFSEQDRTYVPGEQIPQALKDAVIAIEDERFFERGCLDVRAILRAAVGMGKAGGASTITRQLARNALDLKKDNIYVRKLKEFILGCQMESRFSKDDLLTLYLNWIPFGQNAYGIEQASRTYFGVAARDLTLAQSAVLAALPQRPSYFSPYGPHVRTMIDAPVTERILRGEIQKVSQIPDDAITIGLLGVRIGTGGTAMTVGGRTDQVLMDMQDQKFISEAERLQALLALETIVFQPARENIRAPHFVLSVRDDVSAMFKGSDDDLLERGGLKIETTLDWDIQQVAEKVMAAHREDILKRFGANNMALLAVDPATREVLAYVGNADYSDETKGGKIDMVTSPRQPGSSFKPFVYAAAFQNGYSPATILYDVPTKIGGDEPQDFDGKTLGLLTIRQALGASRNIPAAKAFFLAGGEDNILALAHAMGVSSPLALKQGLRTASGGVFDYGWPLALGAAETPLLEMVQGYTTFADGGMAAPIVKIRRITDKNGNILYQMPEKPEEKSALDPRIAYQITSILSDEWARPTEYWKTQLTVPGFQTAAKTGTSNKCLERNADGSCRLRKPDNALVIGYTPRLVVGVWAGNADSSAMYEKADGLTTMSPVWKEFMIGAHRLLKDAKTTFPVPQGIVQPQISLLSGEFPTDCTPVGFRRADVFLEERPPSLPDPACQKLLVDKVTHLLASETCPVEAQESGSFLRAHSILPDRWPLWEQGVQEWVKKQSALWYAAPDHSGSLLPLPVAPEQACDPSLTPGRSVQPTLEILSPSNGQMVGYPSFKVTIEAKAGPTVREVQYFVDGKKVASSSEPPFDRFLRLPRSIAKDGAHVLKIIVIDEYYNQATAEASIRFGEDLSVPSVRLTAPSDDIMVQRGDSLTIRAEASDSDGEIKYVQFYLGETLLTTKPIPPYELTYTIDLPDGVYTLKAVAEDLSRHSSEDALTVTVGAGGSAASEESGEPVILSPDPSVTSILKDTLVDVRIETPSIGGADLTRLTLVIVNTDTGEEEPLLTLTDGSGAYTRVWKPSRPGTYKIRLLAEDRSRQEREVATRTIVVQ